MRCTVLAYEERKELSGRFFLRRQFQSGVARSCYRSQSDVAALATIPKVT